MDLLTAFSLIGMVGFLIVAIGYSIIDEAHEKERRRINRITSEQEWKGQPTWDECPYKVVSCSDCSLLMRPTRLIDHKLMHPAKITEYLYLGDYKMAQNLNELRRCGITAVLNVAMECDRPEYPDDIKCLQIPLGDSAEIPYPQMMIGNGLRWGMEFIEKIRAAGGVVFVHCKAGKSRSSAIIIGYLITKKRWVMQRAFEYVRVRRSCIRPNSGFQDALTNYQVNLGITWHDEVNKNWR